MEWTKETPKKPGWYFININGPYSSYGMRPVRVEPWSREDRRLTAECLGDGTVWAESWDDPDVMFWGPLESPPRPPVVSSG